MKTILFIILVIKWQASFTKAFLWKHFDVCNLKPFDSFGMWMCEQMTWICAHHEAETLRCKANGIVQRVAIHYSNESHRCVNRNFLVDCLYRPRRLVASMFHELDCLVKYSWNGNRGNWIVWFPRNCYCLNVLFSTLWPYTFFHRPTVYHFRSRLLPSTSNPVYRAPCT